MKREKPKESSGNFDSTTSMNTILEEKKKALDEEATAIVLCHNHPSGNLQPSSADEELTKKIKEAANYLDIKVIDHIIVSEDGFYSFADEGIL